MTDLTNWMGNMLARVTLLDVVDITLVAVLIYYVLKLASRTQAMQVLRGIAVVLLVAGLSNLIGLMTFTWVFNYVISIGAILLVVIFRPELRTAFEHIGRRSRLNNRRRQVDEDSAITRLILSLTTLSKQKTGALVVWERQVALGDIIATGTEIGAVISTSMMGTIFQTGTPLHDGAVVIRDGVIEAAGCFLPLTRKGDLPQTIGTRHRAALGMSEVSDSLVFVVSEETGSISCAREGELHGNLDAKGIRTLLEEQEKGNPARGLWELITRGRQED